MTKKVNQRTYKGVKKTDTHTVYASHTYINICVYIYVHNHTHRCVIYGAPFVSVKTSELNGEDWPHRQPIHTSNDFIEESKPI